MSDRPVGHGPPRRSASEFAARAARIGLRTIGALLLALALVELAFRFFGFGPPAPLGYAGGLYRDDPRIGYRMAASHACAMRSSPDEPEIAIRTNGAGYRDEEFGPKRPGTRRVLALGDSFGFGHMVRAEEAYPEVLEAELAGAEVLNLGVPGYNTVHELHQLQAEGPALAPDLVLLGLYVGNDVSENLRSREARTVARSGYLVTLRPGDSDWWITIRAWLNAHSRLWRALEAAHRRRNAVLATDEERIRQLCEREEWGQGLALAVLRRDGGADVRDAYSLTEHTLAEMHAFCRAELRAPLVLVLLPAPHQYVPAMWRTVLERCGLDPAELDPLRPQRELLAAGERLGVPTLDLTPAFARWTAEHADPADVPFLDVHFSAPGHRLAALEIARFLRERGLAE